MAIMVMLYVNEKGFTIQNKISYFVNKSKARRLVEYL